jgi:hypothetical protein
MTDNEILKITTDQEIHNIALLLEQIKYNMLCIKESVLKLSKIGFVPPTFLGFYLAWESFEQDFLELIKQ